jgi:hypothetical protein
MPHPRVAEVFALHPLTKDERTTCESMLQHEGAHITLAPNHHINHFQDLMGFRFDCEPFLGAGALPLVRTMFHGHTLVECQAKEDTILRLMNQTQENKQKMLEFLQQIDRDCVPADLDCIPENASATTSAGTFQAQGLLSVDSKHWTPEVPERIGLYHAYIRGFNRDVRTHRLFIACSGGMARASDAFCNLVIDVGRHWTASDVLESEEAWWLRKGCQRARGRLIKQLADAFDVKLEHMQASFFIHSKRGTR